MRSTDDYQHALALVRQHEASQLADFKGKLRTLIEKYQDAPELRELCHTLRHHAGLDREDEADAHARMMQGLRDLTRPAQ
jgi:hypothetical protein